VVAAADGYGEYDPGAEGSLPRSAFPRNQALEPGMMFHTQDEQGSPQPLWVKRIETDKVFVSRNHPLAGQRLNFKIEVVAVRKATREELAHGHPHGPGGHHH
jgi:FKBP-type peptidyl-prolyl cis-trans isomerase SlyD